MYCCSVVMKHYQSQVDSLYTEQASHSSLSSLELFINCFSDNSPRLLNLFLWGTQARRKKQTKWSTILCMHSILCQLYGGEVNAVWSFPTTNIQVTQMCSKLSVKALQTLIFGKRAKSASTSFTIFEGKLAVLRKIYRLYCQGTKSSNWTLTSNLWAEYASEKKKITLRLRQREIQLSKRALREKSG